MNGNCFETRKHCPACRSAESARIYSCSFTEPPIKDFLEAFYSPQGKIEFEYLEGAFFILLECESCGTIYQKDIPDDFLTNKLYEEWIDPKKAFDLHSTQYNPKISSFHAGQVMMAIALLDKKPHELKFLDFGMGWGSWAVMANAFGVDCCGTELSKARIEHARSKGVKVISWQEIPDHGFDFINTEQIFEHLPNPLETFGHLTNSLKPRGLIRISVPYGEDIKARLAIGDWNAPKGSGNSLNPVSPLEHINCFKRSAIDKMAEAFDFEPAKIPLSLHMAYSMKWDSPLQIIKNIVRAAQRKLFYIDYPIYRKKKAS